MRIGYARVSTHEQDLSVQLARLQECDRIYDEKASGTDTSRPKLDFCLGIIQSGDTLVVTKLDRLARSTWHLCQIAEQLRQKGAHLQVLDQQMDTSTPTGRLLFNTLAAIAQFETELRAERQREGIAKARAKGVHFGRKKVLTDLDVAHICALREQGWSIPRIMERYRIGKTALYRYLAQAAARDKAAAD